MIATLYLPFNSEILMKYFVQATLAVLFAALVSSCGTEKIEAQEAEIEKLNKQLAEMQKSFEDFTKSQKQEAKTELDATGIAIVNLEVLLEKYEGYKTAMKKLEYRYNSILDKVKKDEEDFIKKRSTFEKSAQYLNEEQQKAEYAKLEKEYGDMMQRKVGYEQEYASEQQNLTKDVLGKVNNHLKGYAETNGYQMVLFTPVENNIFYAKDQINITEEYIENLNEAYANGFK